MKAETVPNNRRIYLVIQPMTGGMVRMRLSATPPAYGEPAAVLLSRGVLPLGADISIDVVSNPAGNPDLRGLPGKDGADGASAYQLARDGGYGGTQTAWLASLVGAAGTSAYEVARDLGYGGTKTQWIASLAGVAGLSAYDVAKAAGFVGTQAQWLASLKGAPASAYLGAVTVGQTATVAIAAGVRRLVLTIPASLGVLAGDSLYLAPTVALAGYALHDIVAVSPTSLNIGLTGPLLALNAGFAIPCKLFRLNT